MAYDGHEWQDDELITAERLNAMEDGIESGNADGITSVTVQTLDAGSSATASLSDGVLALGIPKGDKGDTGAAGKDGAAGANGVDGSQGPSGVGVKSIALTTDESGAVTGGTWVDTSSESHTITVSNASA